MIMPRQARQVRTKIRARAALVDDDDEDEYQGGDDDLVEADDGAFLRLEWHGSDRVN